jgi:hypothetical protein
MIHGMFKSAMPSTDSKRTRPESFFPVSRILIQQRTNATNEEIRSRTMHNADQQKRHPT